MRLDLKHIALATLLLAATSSSSVAQSKQAPPPLGTPKAFTLPPRREFTLGNGMKVTFVPFGAVPKVSIYNSVRTGNIDETSNQVWLADVTGELMREGTTSRSALQVAEQGAAMGGQVTVSVGVESSTISGTALSDHGVDMLRLVADITRNPLLPETQLPRIIAGRLRNLSISKSQPGTVAYESFQQTLYGDTPFGKIFPTEEMLKGYNIGMVRDFYARNFGAARSHLYVVGVFDQAAMEAAVRESFGDWKAGSPATERLIKATPKTQVTLLDRPNAPQSTLMIGLPVAAPGSTDYTALQVTDALLGGTFGSRITLNIRENKGYTYSPHSAVNAHRGDAVWYEQADVTTKHTGASIKEILNEVNRLRTEAPPTEELEGVKNNMVGIFTLQNASRAGIANTLINTEVLGLGDDYLTGFVKRVMAVTPADVQRVSKEQLTPDKMTIVVVGDRKTVEEQVAPFQKPVP